ncbi:hypothetical protein D9M68_465480 [compost metagenome]
MDHLQKSNPQRSLKEVVQLFADWGGYLRRQWRLLLLTTLAAAALGTAYIVLRKPVYTATTSFVLENDERSGGLSQYLGMASMIGIDLGGGSGGIFRGDNIIELYKSRQMIVKTLLSPLSCDSSKLLIDQYIDFHHLRRKWVDESRVSNLYFLPYAQHRASADRLTRLRDSLLSRVVIRINEKNLSVGKPDKKLDIIQVDVHDKDDVFAEDFNRQLVAHVNEFYIQTKTQKAADHVQILQQKVDSVQLIMNGAINSAAAVTDATPNLNITRQAQRVAPVQRAQFTAETNKAVLAELLKNLEVAKVSLRKETPLLTVIDQPVFPLANDEAHMAYYPLVMAILAFCLTCLYLLLRKSIRDALHSEV